MARYRKEARIGRHFKEIEGKPFNPIEEVKFWVERVNQTVIPSWAMENETAKDKAEEKKAWWHMKQIKRRFNS